MYRPDYSKVPPNGNAELVIITDEVKELYFTDALNILKRLSIVNSISSLIRVY